ncbi:MAG: hypothetical protein ACREEM_38870 [Blastocatellia bacterium]
MTIEELERSLQTVARQNVELTTSQTEVLSRQQRLEETVQDVVALHQQILRGHESRLAKLEESFQTLVELASSTDGRLDTVEEGAVHTDARLDALIDSQMQLAQRAVVLTTDIAEFNGRMDRIGEHLDRVQSENAERIKALQSENAAFNSRMDRIGEHLDRVAALQSENAERIKALQSENAAFNGRMDRIGEHLDRVAALQSENAERIKSLIAAQARTDEQIRLLLDRKGKG